MLPNAHDAIMPGTVRHHGACGKASCVSEERHMADRAPCSASNGFLVTAWACRAVLHLSLAATLVGCVFTSSGTDGRWVGPVTPVSGTCDPASQAVLLVSPTEATFAPDGGVLLLRGHADDRGHVVADLRTVGLNHQPYLLAFTGELHEDHITGTLVTPRCRAAVTLHRG